MQIVIEIPNKDIPKHQEVIDICLHFIDGHIVGAAGYGFIELPKGHGRLIDADKCAKSAESLKVNFGVLSIPLINATKDIIKQAPTIIEADTESEEREC